MTAKISSFVLLLLITGCLEQPKELIELRNEVRYLEQEIAGIQGSPGYLFGEAFDYLDSREDSLAYAKLQELQQNFPEWNKEIVTTYIEKFKTTLTDQ